MKKLFGEDYSLIKDDSLENYIYHTIPLSIPQSDGGTKSSLLMNKEIFHETLKKIVLKKRTLWNIAELSLDLIKDYIPYRPNPFNHYRINEIPEGLFINWKNFILLFSYSNDIYKVDLYNLMILSYIYNEGNINIKKSSEALTYYLELLRGNEELLKSDNYVMETRLYSEKKYNYMGKKYDAKHKNYLLTSYFDKNFDIDNIFDIELILSLLSLRMKKKNPFCHQDIINNRDIIVDEDTDIKFFLKNLSKLSLNNTHKSKYINNLFNILKEGNNNTFNILKHTKKNNNKLYVYNQFILERILNLNFINQLFTLTNTMNYNIAHALSDWIVSPLLKTRLQLLSLITKDNNNLNFLNKNLGNNVFKDIMKELNEHQISCIIPLAITIFHYLVKLKITNINDKVSKKVEIWCNNINNYTKKEYEEQKIKQIQIYLKQLEGNYFKNYLKENPFFIFNKRTNSVEANVKSIPLNANVNEYNRFVNEQILNFEKLSIKYSQYGFKECLDSVVQDIPQFLKQKIVDIGHFDEGIITD